METVNISTDVAAIAQKRTRRMASRRQLAGFLFVLPAVTFTLVFFIIPLLMTAWMSLHDWPLIGEARFIGIDNYSALTTDRQFWSSLGFTIKYTLLVTPPIFRPAKAKLMAMR